MLTKYLWVFFVSMVPLVELRGSIIISQGLQLPVLSSYIVAIIGNMLPVPVIYLFAGKSRPGAVYRTAPVCRNSASGNRCMDRNTGG